MTIEGDDKVLEPTEILSPGDDARNDVAAAIRQLKSDAPADEVIDAHPEALEAEPPVEDSRARGADGKFITKEAAPEKVVAAEPVLPSTDEPAKASDPASTQAVAPPVSWTAAEKADWSKLPPAIQTAVSRREAEMTNGGRQWSEEKRQLQGIIAPVAEAARIRGLDVGQGIQLLVSAQNALDRNPVEGIKRLAAQYGVDLSTIDSTPAPQPQRIDPAVPQLYQTVTTLQQQVEGFRTAQLQGEISNFSKDKPHFAEVKADMARIVHTLPEGLSEAEILQQSYDQAIWVNPVVRAKMIAEQNAKAESDRTAALQSKATSAKKAAVSIKGSSNGVMPSPKANASGDVFDDVRAAINQLRQ